jgi:hypothetical protein
MKPDMGDPTQQDPSASSGQPGTREQPGDSLPGPAGAGHAPDSASAAERAPTPGPGTPPDQDDADLDDDDDLDIAAAVLDPARHEALIEDLVARVGSMRRRWATLERERHELGRALRRVERERDLCRAAHERVLRRAEDAELRLAEVEARITALADALQQRPRARGGSAKLPGPDDDAGQDFK